MVGYRLSESWYLQLSHFHPSPVWDGRNYPLNLRQMLKDKMLTSEGGRSVSGYLKVTLNESSIMPLRKWQARFRRGVGTSPLCYREVLASHCSVLVRFWLEYYILFWRNWEACGENSEESNKDYKRFRKHDLSEQSSENGSRKDWLVSTERGCYELLMQSFPHCLEGGYYHNEHKSLAFFCLFG